MVQPGVQIAGGELRVYVFGGVGGEGFISSNVTGPVELQYKRKYYKYKGTYYILHKF